MPFSISYDRESRKEQGLLQKLHLERSFNFLDFYQHYQPT